MSTGETKTLEQADADHRLNSVLALLYQANLRSLKNKIDQMKEKRKCVVSSIVESLPQS